MRIIGGKFKGRRFSPPIQKWPTRPTTDFAKEALFNVLHNRVDIEDLKALDLFGGSGTHTYELISRGCTDVVYIDKFPACVQFVRKTSKDLKIDKELRILRADIFKIIPKFTEQFDYIFADPPYALPNLSVIPDLIFTHNCLAPEGLLVLEHDQTNDFSAHPRCTEQRKYGQTIFSFFE